MPRVFHITDSGSVMFFGDGSDYMRLGRSTICYENYGHEYEGSLRRNVQVEGVSCRIVDLNGRLTFGCVQDGTLYIEKDEARLSLKDELVYAFIYSSLYKQGARKLVFPVEEKNENFDVSMIYADLDRQHAVKRAVYLRSPSVIGDSIYGVSGKQLCKLDHNLLDVWRKELGVNARLYSSGSINSRSPTEFGDGILLNLGHIIDETFERDGHSFRYYKRGILSWFAKVDGSLRWQREFDWSIEDMVLHGGKLYVSTNDRLEIVNPQTGETERSVQTGLEMPGHRGAISCLASLLIDGDALYYLPAYEPRILVYELGSLALRKEITLPNFWCPREFQRKATDGRLFFGLHLNAYGAPDIHRYALLEFHPDRLDEPVQMEPEPNMKVELRPSDTEPGKEEVWVEIRDASLDDALRFGELYTQNQAFIQGWHVARMRSPENPQFNGKIHFRYSGSDQPADVVRQKLAEMERRFTKWNAHEEPGNEGEFIYAGDHSKRLCSLDAAYVE